MSLQQILMWLTVVMIVGCGGADDSGPPAKLPRPVSVIALRPFDPNAPDRISGSVASWKTEQLGLEVAGRVQFVIEPETNIQGRSFDSDGTPLVTGTPLARIDKSRYELQVNSANAQIITAQKQKEALEIEISEVVPAQKRAADAELVFQNSELQRITPLVERGAITRAEYDRTLANRDAAQAEVAQIVASLLAKRAEAAASDAKIQELRQSLAEALRDVEECELVSPFPGQIAEVHVIPGAFVQRGQPVVTVQMMNPIKIEFQASAETTRRLSYSDLIPIHVTKPDGTVVQMNAYLYLVDPVADTSTRTFTVLLLSQNRREQPQLPAGLDEKRVATVDGLRMIRTDVEGLHGTTFADVDALYQDSQGHYLWKVSSRSLDSYDNESGPLIKVEKVRVALGKQRVPVMGLWTLQEVKIQGTTFDPKTDLVARKIVNWDGPEPWNGDTLMLDQSRWLMRPGDLVSIDISGTARPLGYYVSMDVIAESAGKHYVFVARDGKAAKIEVTVSDGPGTLKRIVAVDASQLSDGAEVIAQGVHYLVDGEPINIARRVELAP